MIVTNDVALMSVDTIHEFLTNSYWAKGIPRELVERSMRHSLCFAALDAAAAAGGATPPTVGFARVVSDHATFAYIADVFVLPSHRGRGVSKAIMQAIASHPSLQGLRRWHLVTRDAHGLYAQFGFGALGAPERHMEKVVKDAYLRVNEESPSGA